MARADSAAGNNQKQEQDYGKMVQKDIGLTKLEGKKQLIERMIMEKDILRQSAKPTGSVYLINKAYRSIGKTAH